MKNTWTWIAVVLIFAGGMLSLWGLQTIFRPEKPVIKSDTIVKYKLDTIKFAVKEPIYKTFHIKDTVLKEVKIYDTTFLNNKDTTNIVKAFFEKRNYQREIVNDSDLYVSLNDTVSQNQLFGGIGKYVIKRPIQTINNSLAITKPNNQMYVGGQINASADGFGLGASIVLKTRNESLWGVGIEYFPYLSKHPIFGVSHHIKIKL